MKIVTFQYHQATAAIAQKNGPAGSKNNPNSHPVGNCFAAGGYMDRLYREETAPTNPWPQQEICIPGTWQ